MKLDELKAKYSHYLKSAEDHERVGWGSRESQRLRFKIISQMSDDFLNSRILDYGCGLGGFFKYLQEQNFNGSYFGYDILPDMINNARYLNPNGLFFNEIPEENFDYVVASGVFAFSTLDSALSTIKSLYERANKGVAVNFLSSYSFNKEVGEFYCDPKDLLDSCMKLCKKVVLRHDYLPHDFTIYLYK